MSDKYRMKDAKVPISGQKLEVARGFDDYPNWAVFKGEDGSEYTLPYEKVERIEDEEE